MTSASLTSSAVNTGTSTSLLSPTSTSGTSNPYDLNSLYEISMANDYFGSQAFGGNVYNTPAQTTVQTTSQTSTPTIQDIYGQPDNIASALLQSYISAKSDSTNSSSAASSVITSSQSQTMPTIQDYYYATQIANRFSNQTPLIPPDSSYTQTDYFAQQAIPAFNNTTNNVNNTNSSAANISYAA